MFEHDELDTLRTDLSETELAVQPGALEEADNTGVRDPFGLYLHEMGAIPMLSRPQELELAERLDWLRRRYRRAVLWSADALARVVDTFERIQSGAVSLERSVDDVASLG